MFRTLFNTAFFDAYDAAPSGTRQTLGTLDGNNIKIMNFTNYGITLLSGEEAIDYIPPYQFLIAENNTALILVLDRAPTSGYKYTYRSISVRAFEDPQAKYQVGQLISITAGDTINVAGSMSISNTPQVTIAGTPNVAIAGTPNVSITGTPQVAIASGTVNANIQNATLNSNITNALLSTGPSAVGTLTQTINYTAGGGGFFGITLPASYYDQFTMSVYSSGSQLGNYTFRFDQIRYNPVSGSAASFTGPDKVNTFFKAAPGWNHDNSNQAFVSQTISLKAPAYINMVEIFVTNTAGVSIGDTITITIGAKYSSNVVTNQSSQPVPISNNYYGTGADGVLNITGASNIANTANVPFIGNYSSITLAANLGWNNPAKYAVFYCTGDVTINGGATLYAPPGVTNIGPPGQTLSINGKAIQNAGSGGSGGKGGGGSGVSSGIYNGGGGAGGGAGNCFASGAGGGGGGGAAGSNGDGGGGGGTGIGHAGGGASGGGAAQSGGAALNQYTATLCIVAAGTITINGTIYASGEWGGNGGNGGASGAYQVGGGGGACGSNGGGNGSSASGASSGGGGGAGGSGGGVIFLFAGGAVFANGTLNVNGGGGGSGGASGGNGGASGQAGVIQIFQYGGNVGGG